MSAPLRLLRLVHAYQGYAEEFCVATTLRERAVFSYELIAAFRTEAADLAAPYPKLRAVLGVIAADFLELKHAATRFDHKRAWEKMELRSLMNPCFPVYQKIEAHVAELEKACEECG